MAKKLTWRDLETLAICICIEVIHWIMRGSEEFIQDEGKYGSMTRKDRERWSDIVNGHVNEVWK